MARSNPYHSLYSTQIARKDFRQSIDHKAGFLTLASVLMLLLSGLLWSQQSQAAIFGWIDDKGRHHYSDQAPNHKPSRADHHSVEIHNVFTPRVRIEEHPDTPARYAQHLALERENRRERRYVACHNAKIALKKSRGMISERQPDGSSRILSEAERRQVEARRQTEVEHRC